MLVILFCFLSGFVVNCNVIQRRVCRLTLKNTSLRKLRHERVLVMCISMWLTSHHVCFVGELVYTYVINIREQRVLFDVTQYRY